MSLDSGFQVTDKGLMELFRRLEPLIKTMFKAVGGRSLETTDGSIDVNPTLKLVIGDGLVLTNPATGEADVALSEDVVRFDKTPQIAPLPLSFLRVETTGASGQSYNAGTHEIQVNGGSTVSGGTDGGQIFVSAGVQILGQSASPVRSTPAELDVGTSAGADIEAYGNNLRVHLSTGSSGFAVFHGLTGTTKILQARNAGGSDQVGFFNTGPVNQQAAPTSPQTIADALANYGLLAGAGTVVIDGGSP